MKILSYSTWKFYLPDKLWWEIHRLWTTKTLEIFWSTYTIL